MLKTKEGRLDVIIMGMTKKEKEKFKSYRRGFWFLITLITLVSSGWALIYTWRMNVEKDKQDQAFALYKKDIELYRKDVSNLYNQFSTMQIKETNSSDIPVTAYIYAPEVQVTAINEYTPDTYPFLRTDYNRITQLFAIRRHPITGKVSFHHGLDMVTEYQGLIIASASGIVSEVGNDRFYGNYVIIKHGEYYTLYGHLLEYYLYKGQTVKKGQFLGRMGDTGYSEGAHLHFEVFKLIRNEETGKEERKRIDPLTGSGEEGYRGLQGYLNMEYIAGVNGVYVED